MERWTANSLRIIGIILTAVVVFAGGLALAYVAVIIILMGGLSRRAQILRPEAADAFYAIILLVISIVAAGIFIIGRLATGIRGPVPAHVLATTAEVVDPLSFRIHLSPVERRIFNRLILFLGAQIAVSAITWFQVASRAAPTSRFSLLLPFMLSHAPYAILIYFLLKRPGRRAFTFLVAILAVPILETLFNPTVLSSYRQIYMNETRGLLWIALSALIYIVTLILAYQTIQHSGLRLKPLDVTLAILVTSFYFVFIKEITPYFYRLLE